MATTKLDITKNNLSNIALSTPAGQVDPAAHMAAQDIDTMVDFLMDDDLVDYPLSADDIRKMTKNDLVYAVRSVFERGGYTPPEEPEEEEEEEEQGGSE